jgi:3-hydroxybutyryl-CoA dehydrogenase
MLSRTLSVTSRRFTRGIKALGIVGGGQMGNGIAITAAMVAGLDVKVCDVSKELCGKASKFAEKLMAKNVKKGKMEPAAMEAAMSKLTYTTEIEDLADREFVVEAATENPDVKFDLFRKLDTVLAPDVILATNTSSISITRIAAATSRPDKVIGTHFFNPVPVMKLVEVIPGIATSKETLATSMELAQSMNKTCVEARDVPGFIVNRVLVPFINEAAIALYESLGTAEGIDTAMKLGCNLPMGPLLLADFIGLDTCLAVMEVLNKELGDKYLPSVLIKQYVDAGWLGVKSGRGFHMHK